MTSYDNTAQMLRLIPPTAENAFGIDYEMKATFVSHETDKYRNVIKVSHHFFQSTLFSLKR